MIFVTGGTGLVGTHLLYELVSKGEKVRALKRATSNLDQVIKTFSYYSNQTEELFQKIEWVEGDILDYFSLVKLLKGVDSVYHCAAIVSFRPSERIKMISNNVEGTSNLVDASIENGIKKFCHVSSISALGRFTNGYFVDEETKWIPSKKNSGYSESKFYSEMEIWRGIEEGLDAVIVNPSIILGPGNWKSGSPQFFSTIWKGLKFYTKGVTGYVSVQDVVNAMILLMHDNTFPKTKNQRFLLNAENLSYQELFYQIADALNKPRPKYFASGFVLRIGWRLAAFISFFTGKPSAITRETVSASKTINRFDGSKITKNIDFTYTPIAEAIKQYAGYFKSDLN